MSQIKEVQGSLLDFSFDGDEEANSFFAPPDKKEDVFTKVNNKSPLPDDEEDDDGVTDIEKDKNKSKPKEEDEEETISAEDFGSETKKPKEVKKVEPKEEKEEKEEEVVEKKDTKKKEKEVEDEDEGDPDFFSNLASDLKERGIFANAELPKDGKITEDKFFELHDEEIESRVDETLEALFKEVGDDGKRYLKFVKEGGNSSQFLAQLSTRFDIDELDEENESQLNKTIRHYLSKYEKNDEEEIEDRLRFLKDGGKLKSYGVKYFNTIKKDEKITEDNLIASQEQFNKDRVENVKVFNDKIRTVLGKSDKIGSFTFTKAEQKDLDTFITKPTFKIDKNKYVPEFQAKLANILSAKNEESRKALVILAKLVKMDFKIDIESEEDKETKITSKIKSKLARDKQGGKNTSSGNLQGRSLADLIDT